MDITPYVDHLRHDLAAAAEAGGEEVRAAAERLAVALDPAVRLALMEALSQAAAEVTSELPAGSVEVRLRGREPQFVVDLPEPSLSASPAAAPADDEDDLDEGATARVTLRIPEALKAKAEEMAARKGQSLNTWIVQAIREVTRERAINVDLDLSSLSFVESPVGPAGPGRLPRGRRMTGWI